jgi:hypothetical protein
MKKHLFLLTSAFLLSMPLLVEGAKSSQAKQVINVNVPEETSLTVSGNPLLLAISLDSDGSGSATDTSTTYTVVSNTGENKQNKLKITGAITSGGDMPNNASLSISLSSQEGQSQGEQKLSTSSSNLVLRLKPPVQDTGDITYTFSVTNGWTISAQALSRVVTLTLTSES